MPRTPPSLLVGLLGGALLLPAGTAHALTPAPASTPMLTVAGSAGERSGLASNRTLLAVATPTGDGRIRVALRPTVGSAGARTRTLPARVRGVRVVLAAVDRGSATTVAWQGAGGRAYAATLDARGRVLSPVGRVPLGPAMRLTGLAAGPGGRRTLLTASVRDLLQDPRGYCRLPDGQFAGDTTFGALKSAHGRFGRPTDTGTGDYPGGAVVAGATAFVADGSGDLAALASTRAPARGRCTTWSARPTLGAAGIRSYAAIDAAEDGTLVAAGLDAPGPFVGSGDEETDPPTPAPQPLRVVIQAAGAPLRRIDVGPGTAPAVAAGRSSTAVVAFLDQPPAGAFGGGGAVAPTTLKAAYVGGANAGPIVEPIEDMLADPAQATVPQVAAGADGSLAILEAAGRYRLSRRDEGGRHETEDLGPVVRGTTLELTRIGGVLGLVSRSATGLVVRGT